jgi:ABC-type nitrate/sulfonate/bicarbonate transport system substrate-binding protein
VTSSELDPLHPEKVLMVRGDFAVQRGEEHVALVAALLEACEFCDEPENHEQIIQTLARPEYVGASADALRHGMDGVMDFGHDTERAVSDFCIFHRDNANEPSGDKAAWALDLVRASGFCKEPSAINFAFAKKIFRPDIFEKAAALCHSTPTQSEYENESQAVLV